MPQKAHEKYFAKNYSQVKLSMPKDEADALDEYCKKRGLTRAGFIRDCIKEKIYEGMVGAINGV